MLYYRISDNQLHEDITAFREKERADDKSDDNSLKKQYENYDYQYEDMKTGINISLYSLYSILAERLCKTKNRSNL